VGGTSTRLHLHPEDGNSLLKTLPRLPGGKEENAPVTLDLGKAVAVRACSEKEASAEVVLTHSRMEGPPVSVVMDRRFLLRAVQLGFQSLTILKADRPVLCQDEGRTYLWMPLEAGKPEETPSTPAPTQPVPTNPQPARRPAVPSSNGTHLENPREGHEEPTDLLAEAEALRALLQEGAARAGRLIAALKHQRKQTRALQAALTSLRKLQQLES
jgi:hypothetical protein